MPHIPRGARFPDVDRNSVIKQNDELAFEALKILYAKHKTLMAVTLNLACRMSELERLILEGAPPKEQEDAELKRSAPEGGGDGATVTAEGEGIGIGGSDRK